MLFWFFGILEIIFTLPTFLQSIKQLTAFLIVPLRYHLSLPHTASSITYSLPFKGCWTVVNGGITQTLSHSWNIFSQRYAYDFLKLDPNGKSYYGNSKILSDHFCYEQEILAPADGTVVEIKNHIKDSKILGLGRVDPTTTDLRGNYIIIQHTPKEFSLLAHLKPDSICVLPGQKVHRGDIIAKCGNSGNSTEPHLHFQVQDRKSFFTSMGIPIVFQNIEVSPAENYSVYDPRKLPHDTKLKSDFIHRGLTVCPLNYK